MSIGADDLFGLLSLTTKHYDRNSVITTYQLTLCTDSLESHR